MQLTLSQAVAMPAATAKPNALTLTYFIVAAVMLFDEAYFPDED